MEVHGSAHQPGETKRRSGKRLRAARARQLSLVEAPLKSAVGSSNVEAIEEALQVAIDAGLGQDHRLVQTGRAKILELRATSGPLSALAQAVGLESPGLIIDECVKAQASGIERSLILLVLGKLSGKGEDTLKEIILERLRCSYRCRDITHLRAVIEAAKAVGLADVVVKGAELKLQEAKQAEHAEDIEKACTYGEVVGLDQHMLDEARAGARKLSAKATLIEACKQDCSRRACSQLFIAVAEAEAAAVDDACMKVARKRLDFVRKARACALAALQAALWNNSPWDIDDACCHAYAQGLMDEPEAVLKLQSAIDCGTSQEVKLASAELRALGLSSPAAQSAQVLKEYREYQQYLLSAQLSVGQTDNHNRLAILLGMVLTDHQMIYELPLIQSQLFLAEHSRAFSLTPASYGDRGGRPYIKPCGWLRYSLRVDRFDEVKDWCVAYHGTANTNTLSILLSGLRRPDGQQVQVAHGQAYSDTNRTIYLSPSIEYAAHPVYAQFFELEEGRWGQLVFQCRVRPNAFREAPSTLGKKHWPRNLLFDPSFSNEALEWLVEDPSDVVACGLMVREFGPQADATLHGELVRCVSEGNRGAEYEWIRLLIRRYRQLGLYAA